MNIVVQFSSSPISPSRNNNLFAAAPHSLTKIFRIVTFIGNQTIKAKIGNQIVCLPMIALLARGQNKTNRVAQRIGCQVNLG